MLTPERIKTLCDFSGITTYTAGLDIIAINYSGDVNTMIKIPYEEFKAKMELQELRLHWLTNDRAFIAGGAVLNWIWDEHTNSDIDFFFKDEDTCKNFKLLLNTYKFEETYESAYASTFFNSDAGLICQVVGGRQKTKQGLFNFGKIEKSTKPGNFQAFGTPQEVILNFDIALCSFAADCDYVYFPIKAVVGLITKIINKESLLDNHEFRGFKYSRKGFYISGAENIYDDESF